jgi:hypothetical protein
MRARDPGPGELGPVFPWMSRNFGHLFLATVMKAFQEMRGRVKYIAAATCLWLVCFYFKNNYAVEFNTFYV